MKEHHQEEGKDYRQWVKRFHYGFWVSFIILTVTGNLILPTIAYLQEHQRDLAYHSGFAYVAATIAWVIFGVIPSLLLVVWGHLTGRLLRKNLTPKQRLCLYTIPLIVPITALTLFIANWAIYSLNKP